MRDYLRTFSLCFEFWKNYRPTEPFPGIGFQTTNERRPPDDLPSSEVNQSNPISAHYRSDSEKHKQSFLPSLPKDSLTALVERVAATLLHTLEQCLH